MQMIEYLENAGGFVSEQAPEIIRQILFRGTVCSVLLLVLFSTLAAILIIVMYKFLKSEDYEEEDKILWGALSGVVIILSILAVSVSAYNLFNIIFAPKLYLFEYLGGVLK